MKYEYTGDLQNPNWFDIADLIATERWDIAEACTKLGCTTTELRLQMARLGANMQGASFVAGLAATALKKIDDADKATLKGRSLPGPDSLSEPMPSLEGMGLAAAKVGTAASKNAATVGGVPFSTVVGVAVGVIAVAAGLNYARTGIGSSSPATGSSAPQRALAPAAAATAATQGSPAGLVCSRGEAIVTHMGSQMRPGDNSVTFQDPDTLIANTLSWQPPPVSIRIDDDVPLESWSTHNGGRPMEVQWESGAGSNPDWGYGASSKTEFANEGRKIIRLRFRGGSVRIRGGVNSGPLDQTFRMQWDYYCKS